MKNTDGLKISPGFLRLLPVLIGLNAIIGAKRIIGSFLAPDIYRKDFIQEYLMAKAILNGINPYLPLSELINRWIGPVQSALHLPTPHPPIIGLLSLPLGFLSYEKAAIAWLIFELFCLSGSLILLLRWWGTPIKPWTFLIAFGIAIGWLPVIEELWLGQLSTFLLFLLLGAWWGLRTGKDGFAGALLGGMIALKLSAWPLVIFLGFRRRWKAVIGAAVVVITTNLLSLSLLGIDYVQEYYLKIAPLISTYSKLQEANFSLWTLGQRFFLGFGVEIFVPPLWESPFLARTFSILVPVIILLLGLRFSIRAENFDTSFGLMVVVGVIVNPVAWTHSLVLTAIPLAILARRLSREGFPKYQCYLAFGIWLTLSIVLTAHIKIAKLFSNQSTADGVPIVPFAAGLMTLIPVVGLVALSWMLWQSDYDEKCMRAVESDSCQTNKMITAST